MCQCFYSKYKTKRMFNVKQKNDMYFCLVQASLTLRAKFVQRYLQKQQFLPVHVVAIMHIMWTFPVVVNFFVFCSGKHFFNCCQIFWFLIKKFNHKKFNKIISLFAK